MFAAAIILAMMVTFVGMMTLGIGAGGLWFLAIFVGLLWLGWHMFWRAGNHNKTMTYAEWEARTTQMLDDWAVDRAVLADVMADPDLVARAVDRGYRAPDRDDLAQYELYLMSRRGRR